MTLTEPGGCWDQEAGKSSALIHLSTVSITERPQLNRNPAPLWYSLSPILALPRQLIEHFPPPPPHSIGQDARSAQGFGMLDSVPRRHLSKTRPLTRECDRPTDCSLGRLGHHPRCQSQRRQRLHRADRLPPRYVDMDLYRTVTGVWRKRWNTDSGIAALE